MPGPDLSLISREYAIPGPQIARAGDTSRCTSWCGIPSFVDRFSVPPRVRGSEVGLGVNGARTGVAVGTSAVSVGVGDGRIWIGVGDGDEGGRVGDGGICVGDGLTVGGGGVGVDAGAGSSQAWDRSRMQPNAIVRATRRPEHSEIMPRPMFHERGSS